MEVQHLHKLLIDKDDKIKQFSKMFIDCNIDAKTFDKFTAYMEANFMEYNSDNEAD